MIKTLKLLVSPPLLFAIANMLYAGQKGGPALILSGIFMALIVLSYIGRGLSHFISQPPALWYRVYCHKAMPQALVGAMCASIVPMELSNGGLTPETMLFMGSGAMYAVANLCIAYQFKTDFKPLAAKATSLLLIPQIWALTGNGLAMAYNGGITLWFLPITVLSAWFAAYPHIGRYAVPKTWPNYLSALYNFAFAACNFMGDAPNAYVIISCLSCIIAYNQLAHRVAAGALEAERAAMAAKKEVDTVETEIPGLTLVWNPSNTRLA